MRLSGSYFKKLDDFAKWLFRRHNNLDDNAIKNNAKNQQEPKTQNDNSGVVDMELSIHKLRPIKTEGESNKKAKINKQDATLVQTCTICLDKIANAVLMNCGHGAICFNCGLTLLSTACECHLCRQQIVQVLRIDIKGQNDDLLKVIEAADLFNIGNYKNSLFQSSENNN